ncbi:hypothetical protein HDU92_002931 [Lobulomyces angularis]|nr:hypothetical protein HDU92_002931 [Lobulomyces angularis]
MSNLSYNILSHSMNPVDIKNIENEMKHSIVNQKREPVYFAEVTKTGLGVTQNFDGKVFQYNEAIHSTTPTQPESLSNSFYLGGYKKNGTTEFDKMDKQNSFSDLSSNSSNRLNFDENFQKKLDLQNELRFFEKIQKKELEQKRQLSAENRKQEYNKFIEEKYSIANYQRLLNNQILEKKMKDYQIKEDEKILMQQHIKDDYWKPQYRNHKEFEGRKNFNNRFSERNLTFDPISGRSMPHYEPNSKSKVYGEFDFNPNLKPSNEYHNSLKIPEEVIVKSRYPKNKTDNEDYHFDFGREGCGAPILNEYNQLDPMLTVVRSKNSKLEKLRMYNFDQFES